MKYVLVTAAAMLLSSVCTAGTKTWDGKYDTDKIEVTVVYFVPADRRPLTDWRDRVDYFCGRIEQFHAREFQGQSTLRTIVHPTPLISESTTRILRAGEYRLTLIVEPLDDPHGLILGQRAGDHRFVTLFNFARGEVPRSAIENVDGNNVGNETTFAGQLFRKGQLSQVIVGVSKDRVTMSVDGRTIANWSGKPERLSLSEYWATPNRTALFLGAYDCRYRFHRITLETVSGTGRVLASE